MEHSLGVIRLRPWKGFGPQEIQEGKRAEIKVEHETSQGDEAREP